MKDNIEREAWIPHLAKISERKNGRARSARLAGLLKPTPHAWSVRKDRRNEN